MMTVRDQIESVCDRFHEALRLGESPRIEEYLRKVPTRHAPAVFKQIFKDELTWRYEEGKYHEKDHSDYLRRFPEYAIIINKECERIDKERERTHVLDAPGQRIGDYELIEPLGRGGMGIVYKARNVYMHRVVALKVLRSRTPDDRLMRRFLREIKAVGSLKHPNIVEALHASEYEGGLYFVMEFVPGFDIGKVISRSYPFPFSIASEMIRQAALGLQHINEHQMVHRDIKPSNLILTASGQIKILDLGLAGLDKGSQHDIGDEAPLTDPGQPMGTRDYMAPEQFDDAGSVGIEADIYGLGCTLFHMLAGVPPFHEYRGWNNKKDAHARSPIPGITRQPDDCPAALENIVRRMMAKRPDQRYASPSEVARLLEPFAGSEAGDQCRELVRKLDLEFRKEQESVASTDPRSKKDGSPTPNSCPYVGLRAFSRKDSEVYFGREDQIEALVERLNQNRFLTILGPSGCGKSSMILAGVLPTLRDGFVEGAGPHWRVAVMRPGQFPFQQLTSALLDKQALGPERGGSSQAAQSLETTLRRGPWGLADAINESGLDEGTNFVLVVDQFEELFRYRELGQGGSHFSTNEAQSFINLLLTPTREKSLDDTRLKQLAIYVIVTMRWDFLDDQFHFTGLTEIMNESAFFVPRLTRNQCMAAIAGPARYSGSEIHIKLVNRLLNDTDSDIDQLPLLQHTLMRIWDQPESTSTQLNLSHYEVLGKTPSEILSAHADSVHESLGDSQQRVAQKMFQALCDVEGDRAVRRPVMVAEVSRIADVDVDCVIGVANAFRSPSRSFLNPESKIPLTDETILDISHECLIRRWTRLADWMKEERQSADTYRRLLHAARRWDSERRLWPYRELPQAMEWMERIKPNSAWAERYGSGFRLVEKFLDAQVDLAECSRPESIAFDVFLCHNGQDKPAVIKIAEQLNKHRIRPWLDEWELKPGRTWQDELPLQIDSIRCAAIFIGPHGESGWQELEIRGLLNEFVERRIMIIPVILPEVDDKIIPPILRMFTWADFRKDAPDPLEQLVWGITGRRPA